MKFLSFVLPNDTGLKLLIRSINKEISNHINYSECRFLESRRHSRRDSNNWSRLGDKRQEIVFVSKFETFPVSTISLHTIISWKFASSYLFTNHNFMFSDKPSPPRGPLEIFGMTQTSFSIKWQPSLSDGGSPIIEYIVEMKDVTSKKSYKKVGSTKGDVTEIPVNYLEKEHAYLFKITARNAIGSSEPYIPEQPIVAGSRISKISIFILSTFI